MNTYLNDLVQILHIGALRLHNLHYDAIQLTERVHAASRRMIHLIGSVDQIAWLRFAAVRTGRTVVRIIGVQLIGPTAALRLIAVRRGRSD